MGADVCSRVEGLSSVRNNATGVAAWLCACTCKLKSHYACSWHRWIQEHHEQALSVESVM